MTFGSGAAAARVAACVVVSALAGCAANPFATAKIDPASPAAADVAKAADRKGPYPRFADIPPMPSDVRAPMAYGHAAAKIETARDELERATAPGTWALNDSLGFAASATARAGSDTAPGAQDTAASEALAKRLRDRATPPPLTR